MKRHVALIALAATAALAYSSMALSDSASGWRVVRSKSVSGQYALTVTSATVGHPKGLAVRFTGSGVSGQVLWVCSKGYSVASWTHAYGKGLHILGHVRGKDSCDVTASISGQGRITVQILKRR
jgi:hypothetical protein